MIGHVGDEGAAVPVLRLHRHGERDEFAAVGAAELELAVAEFTARVERHVGEGDAASDALLL